MRKLMFSVAVLLIVSSGAMAAWTAKDDEAIKDLGFTAGMGDHCGVSTTELVAQSAAYIGVHTKNDNEAARAGQLFRVAMDEGKAQMKKSGMPCSVAAPFVDGKVRAVTSANKTRSKL